MIVICGADGTGKSTLANDLAKTSDLFVVEGYSRAIKACRDQVELTKEAEQILLNEITLQNYCTHICTNAVMVRSILDIIVYSRVLTPDLDVSRFLSVWNRTKADVSIIYCPVEFEDKSNDDLRFKSLQGKIDLEFCRLLRGEAKLIVSGDPNTRLRQALKYLAL